MLRDRMGVWIGIVIGLVVGIAVGIVMWIGIGVWIASTRQITTSPTNKSNTIQKPYTPIKQNEENEGIAIRCPDFGMTI